MSDPILDENYHAIFISGWQFKATIFSEIASQFNSFQFIEYSEIKAKSISFGEYTEQLCNQLSLPTAKKTVLIGWSLGGLFTIEMANKLNDRINAVILIASSPFFSESKLTNWFGISQLEKEKFYFLFENNKNKLIRRFINLVSYPVINKNISNYLSYKSDCHWHLLLKFLFEIDLREKLKTLIMPVLSILGTEDAILKINKEQLENLNINIQIQKVQQAGHIPFITHQELITYRIKDFLDAAS
ncbi:alpha/beta fold hydrolase [Thiotrichales bacterium 19S3-7]|nr:alpha/beta fold hydrolase [Thiotrichales bacterium 19S3-7]MCF6802713.1 alpha/beta fold hydrolase [Thiotrichales bacterium 19S3-11]